MLLTGQVAGSIALLIAFLLVGFEWMLADVSAYHGWAAGILDGGALPYRDFPFEYPPLALVTFLVPQLVTAALNGSLGIYVVAFATFMGLLVIAVSQTVRATAAAAFAGRAPGPLGRYLLLMLVAMPLLLVRFDPFPILFATLAFWYVVDRRPLLSGVTLGIGIAAKLYPALLVPLFAAYWWQTEGRRVSVVHVASAVVTALVLFLPFLIIAPDGLLEALRFQGDRGLQIETVMGGLIQLFHLGSPETYDLVLRTTWEVEAADVDVWLSVQPAVALAAVSVSLAITWLRGYRPAPHPWDFVVMAEASIALMIVFMVTSRVLSPQNVFWILPFAAFLTGIRYRLVLATVLVTVLVFPLLYDELIVQELGAVLLLNLRKVLLLVTAAVLLAPPPAREPARGGGDQEVGQVVEGQPGHGGQDGAGGGDPRVASTGQAE